MRTTLIVWIGSAGLSAACMSALPHKPEERTPASVATTPVELTDIASSIDAGGVVRARVTAFVASRVMAPIVDVRVRAGDRVGHDDVLVTLDARDLRANDARAQAAAMSANESVRAAEADVGAADSALELATLAHDRTAALHQKRSATTEELDQAVAALAGAQAHRAAVQARLAAASAARDAAKAAADAAAVSASYATLTAPFSGIVAERSADAGSMAMPGTPLLTLEDPATYRLEVRLDESRAALITRGVSAAVRLDAGDGSMTGRVVEIARVDVSSHSVLVKIDLPATAGIRSGQFGRASFAGPSHRALTVPRSALVPRGQLTFVFIADADRHVHLRPVSIGASAGEGIEVLSGVRQGERVVMSPDVSLADGAAIAGAQP